MNIAKAIKRICIVILCLICCAFVGCGGAEQKQLDEKKQLTIMTYNIYHCGYYYEGWQINYDEYAKVIKNYNPDILGMNEVRNGGNTPETGNQTEILAEKCGYKFFKFGKAIERPESEYGNAILSKQTVENVEIIPIVVQNKEEESLYEDRCIIKAKLKNGLTVLISHFGEFEEEQKLAVEIVCKNLVDEKCILMGDFNVEPTDKILQPVKDRMVDCATITNDDYLSWPSDDVIQKLDYIFVSKDIKINSFFVPKVLCSDHRPAIAEIEI